jgi:hypothetical protein
MAQVCASAYSFGSAAHCDLEGVAGEPSSCRRLKLAWRSWPARFGINLGSILVCCRNPSITFPNTHLSPCIRGLLRLGLAIGVLSRTLPACSKSLSALESADASTGSELRLRVWLRLCVAVGGVFDSGGEMSAGVAMPSSICSVSVDCSTASRRAMLLDALCRDRW